MKVKIEISKEELTDLHLLLLDSPRPWWSLAGSAVAHGVASAVILLAARYMLPEDPEILYRQIHVDPVPIIEVHIPPQLFLRTPPQRSETPAPPTKSPLSKPKLTVASSSTPAPAPPAKAEPSPAPMVRRKFELPPTVQKVQSQQTILQIDPPEIQAVTQTRLPELVTWTAVDRIKAPPKKFVAPGQKIPAPANPALLDAPPVLATPNQELRVAEIKVAAVRAVNPKLTVAPSTTSTMRSIEIQAPPEMAVNSNPIPGQPANLILTNPNPAPLTPDISVPSVAQLGAMPVQSGAGSGTGTGGAPRGMVKTGTGSDPNAGAKGEGTTPGGVTAGNPNVTIAGGGSREGTRLGTGSATGVATAPPIRIFHPDNGVFDVVVTRTSTSDVLPGTAGLLTGQTVYMVYLKVGASKEWILQYCDPKSSARQSGSVITLGSPAPVKAPYPRKTIVPPTVSMKNQGRAVFQGFLDATGQFKDLKLVGQEEAELAAVLVPFLRQWEFRPATRDGKPIEVEVLLAVPPSAY